MEKPEEPPERFITVERIGGSTSHIVVDRPKVAIQAWATTRLDAGLLANQIKSAVTLMPTEIPRVTRATMSSSENYPATHEEQTIPRYQIIVDLVTK
jgi:hypothetical protein